MILYDVVRKTWGERLHMELHTSLEKAEQRCEDLSEEVAESDFQLYLFEVEKREVIE